MRKISLVALFAALVMSVNATDIWTGSKHVSWSEGGLQIAADQFAASQPGNLLKCTSPVLLMVLSSKVNEIMKKWKRGGNLRFL